MLDEYGLVYADAVPAARAVLPPMVALGVVSHGASGYACGSRLTTGQRRSQPAENYAFSRFAWAGSRAELNGCG